MNCCSVRAWRWSVGLLLGCLVFVVAMSAVARADDEPPFLVGAADRDITPPAPMPMWGYADRHAALSDGVLDPLFAKAVVIQAGKNKVAIVGTDLGRGPTIAMMKQIREALAKSCGIEHVIISGSHSHHGPVIELTNQEGHGRGKFDAAVAYAEKLPQQLIEVIQEAHSKLTPAKIGVAKKNVDLNRNRHTKRQPRVTDPMLAVIRFDDREGKPIAVLVNFAAHPTMIDSKVLKFSAEYPGAMKRKVETAMNTKCVFMQGAAGDMSPNPPAGVSGPQQFGEALADRVLELAQAVETTVPERPSIEGKVDRVLFSSRVDFRNKLLMGAFARAFFPELTANFADELSDGILAETNTVLLNREIGFVSGSGEFFCNHSNRLKERSYLPHTFFFGYANGHNLYFPTIEAASEGGYGADPMMSPVELGAGERLINTALINLYGMWGKFAPQPVMMARPEAVADKKE